MLRNKIGSYNSQIVVNPEAIASAYHRARAGANERPIAHRLSRHLLPNENHCPDLLASPLFGLPASNGRAKPRPRFLLSTIAKSVFLGLPRSVRELGR